MEYKDGDYSAVLNGAVLKLSGKIEKSDYSDFAEYLNKVDSNVSDDKLTVDMKDLEFLNSSGIRTLAVFFMGTSKSVDININDMTWQRVGIEPLSNLKPGGTIKVLKNKKN